jgi:hypothetical protein
MLRSHSSLLLLPEISIWLDQIHTKFASTYADAMERRILGVPPVEREQKLKTLQGQGIAANHFMLADGRADQTTNQTTTEQNNPARINDQRARVVLE